jgi:hypothetical protein
MAPFRYLTALSVVGLALLVAIQQASAITAEDVMKKMSPEQRAQYLAGLIDMLAYQTAASGDRAKGSCILAKFYDSDSKSSLAQTLDVFKKYPDKRPEILLTVLANQICK